MKKLFTLLLSLLFLTACNVTSTNLSQTEVNNLITQFNQEYSQSAEMPQLKWLKTQGDTVFVEVLNDEYLASRIGSTGAGEFMKQAVFSLTETEGIQYVDFSFDEGDHASPGKYSREDVEGWGI